LEIVNIGDFIIKSI